MSEDPKRRNDYLQYSGIGIQMVVTILLFTFGGYKLDQHFGTSKPIWTAILSILGVVVAIMVMLRGILKPPKKKP